MARPRKSSDPFAHMSAGKSEGWMKKTLKRTRKTAAEPAAKRGRGRPKGSTNKTSTNKMKSDWKGFTSAVNTPRGRGRPAKGSHTYVKKTSGVGIIARKRGRPPKVTVVVHTPTSTVKRGRGRPPKVTVVVHTPTSTVKRGRGRPRKVHTVAPVAKTSITKVTKKSVTGAKRRGRPVGSKDTKARKKRGIDMSDLIGRPVKTFKPKARKTNLSRKGESALARKPNRTSTNVKAVVHRTVSKKIGTIKSKGKRGMLRSA